MKKYLILISSVLIQLCLGGIYAWSSFVAALQNSHGLSSTQTQIIFGLTMLINTPVMLYAGRLLSSIGPRFTALVAGIFFGAGFLVAAFSGGNFWLLLGGISVLSAVGIGLGYITPLVTCIKWFPEHEGLVSGVSVAGFGGGAILLATSVEYLYILNFSTLDIFELIGYCYGAVIIFGALLLEYPKKPGQADDKSIHFKIIFTNPLLWLLGFFLFSTATGGLMVIGNLKPLALKASLSNWSATLAISVFAGGNASGRIIWGWIADRIGWRAIPASLFLISLAIFGLLFFSFSSIAFLLCSFVVGLGFGACFVVYVTYLSQRYGANKIASVYPPVFLSFGIAGGVGPVISGYLLEITGNYSAGLLLAAILSGLAGILSLVILRRL